MNREPLPLADTAPSGKRSSYTLGWTIDLVNPHAIWDAAAATLLAATGMIIENVDDTLGPREDPNVIDCLITLLPCITIPGCEATVLCTYY